ncbi:hypothetical protein AB0H43_10530 [Hamadaea sp. NPDC050747]|uniref:hypothetical protein n=1 Tax=Hamadaea sp. NPDC050747 TaxID=3155789 RepID=UPI0033CB914A
MTVMGAKNVIAALTLYSDKVYLGERNGGIPPISLIVLVHMAAHSRDKDDPPFYEYGHDHIAASALGRPRPTSQNDRNADLKAVQRAIEPLRRIGAVTIVRRPTVRRDGRNSTTRYVLNLKTVVDTERTNIVQRRTAHGGRTSSGHGGRSASTRGTTLVDTGDERRPPKEYEELLRKEEDGVAARKPPPAPEEEMVAVRTDLAVPRAREAANDQNTSTTTNQPTCPDCRVYLDRDGSCFMCGSSS